MNNFFDSRFKNLSVAVLATLALFLLVATFGVLADIKLRKQTSMPVNVISVRATGEAVAVPDIANFSFTVSEVSKDVAEAKNKMSDKANKAIAYLKEQGIAEEDIKTENYTAYPEYEYQQTVCTSFSCPPSRSVITGFRVSETVSVKVRDVSKAGDLLSGIANLSVGEVSGLSFVVDEQENLKQEAKADAIAKARKDAEATAKSLGVRLGKVTSFYEEVGGGYGYGYAGDMAMMEKSAVAPQAGGVAPDFQPGQQKVTSVVSITYEVR